MTSTIHLESTTGKRSTISESNAIVSFRSAASGVSKESFSVTWLQFKKLKPAMTQSPGFYGRNMIFPDSEHVYEQLELLTF